MTGVKHDAEKVRYGLLPWDSVTDVARVFEYGARKYGEKNWLSVDNAAERYSEAAMRHMVAHLAGDRLDPESGLPHWAHAVASLLMAGWHLHHKEAEFRE